MNKSYIRELALEYAYKWALKRNPKYYLTRKDGIGPIGKIVNICIFSYFR